MNQSDNFGFSVSSLGDLNQDSIPDIIVGANGDGFLFSYFFFIFFVFRVFFAIRLLFVFVSFISPHFISIILLEFNGK